MNTEITIEYYENDRGKSPYIEWENGLPKEIRAQVRKRINHIRLGNFGDCKTIKGVRGIFEIRLHLGPGYRIYFCKKENKIVILLCGGDKK